MKLRLAACAIALCFPSFASAAAIDPGTIVVGCQYNSAGITLANGNYANLQCNSVGQLATSSTSGGTSFAGGVAPDTAFPGTVSSSGTSLGTLPANSRGLIIHLPPGAGVSFYIATSQAASASAAATVAQTYFNPSASTTNLDLQENLSGNYQIWITNIVNGTATTFVSGLPVYRFI